MKFSLLLAIILILLEGCCSCDAAKDDAAATADFPSVFKPGQATALKSNVSLVEATVDSIIIDGNRFSVIMQIESARAIEEDLPSLAEEGQRISAQPRFLPNNEDPIDLTITENKKLLSLRDAKPGTRITARVSMVGPGRWVLMTNE